MAFPWNPRDVLDCHPNTPQFHCSGTTLKGVRCRNYGFFRKDLLHEASQIIDNLPHPEHFRNDPAQLIRTLKRLAFCTLCPRWHQLDRPNHRSQVESVANAWLGIMMQLAAQRPRSNNGGVGPVRVRASTSITSASTLPVSRPARSAGTSSHYLSPPPSPSAISIASSSRTSNGRYTPSRGASSLQSGNGHSNGHYPTPPSSRSATPSSSNSTPSRRSLPASSAPSTTSSSSSSSSGLSSPTPQAQNSEFGSVQVDVNVSVNVGGQHRHQRSHRDQSVTSPNNTDHPSPSRRTSTSSSHSPSVSDTVVITRHDLEAVLNRIATLEERLAEGSNRNSRASSRSSSRAPGYSRSQAPSPSTITNFSIPLLINWDSRVSDIEAALLRARNGPLSISTDNPVSTHTPLSSGTSTPTLSSPEDPVPVANNPFPGLPRRRPIDNTSCYVCYEIIDHPEDATWCRNGCGQNVCLECFETWRAHQESQGRAITCGFCRALWRV